MNIYKVLLVVTIAKVYLFISKKLRRNDYREFIQLNYRPCVHYEDDGTIDFFISIESKVATDHSKDKTAKHKPKTFSFKHVTGRITSFHGNYSLGFSLSATSLKKDWKPFNNSVNGYAIYCYGSQNKRFEDMRTLIKFILWGFIGGGATKYKGKVKSTIKRLDSLETVNKARAHRMEVLTHIYEKTIDYPSYSTSKSKLIEEIHDIPVTYTLNAERIKTHYQLILMSLRESGDLKPSEFGFMMEPKALETLSDYAIDKEKHNDQLNSQKKTRDLTKWIIIFAFLNILIQTVNSWGTIQSKFIAPISELFVEPQKSQQSQQSQQSLKEVSKITKD